MLVYLSGKRVSERSKSYVVAVAVAKPGDGRKLGTVRQVALREQVFSTREEVFMEGPIEPVMGAIQKKRIG
jgi:hypothetical protein